MTNLPAIKTGDATAEFGRTQAEADDIDCAVKAFRTHCPISWPEGLRCNNCGRKHPCFVHEWAYAALSDAGWTEEAILVLDTRTGAWS